MVETMGDRGKFWTPAPDRAGAELRGDGWSARRVPGLGQTLVSGDLRAATAALAPGAPEVGLWGIAAAMPCRVRIARDRALLVTPAPPDVAAGWRDGFVASACDDAYAIIDISGPALPEIVAEATSADLEGGSRSVAVLFAGVTVLLYRVAADTARIHVEAPLAAYLRAWLETRRT